MRLSPCLTFAGALFAAASFCGCEAEQPAAEIPLPAAERRPAHERETGTEGSSKDFVATGPFLKQFEGISFLIPKGWQEVKLAGGLVGFVDARFVIPAEEGTVELTCLTSGGGIDENVSRWVGQFDVAPNGSRTETIDVGEARGTWVDLRGTFNGNASGKTGPHPKWRMLGAGIPVGPRAFFLKLNGPQAAVERIHDEFRDFVKSGKIE